MKHILRVFGAVLVLAIFSIHVLSAQEKQRKASVKLGASGLQVPRFVSLKSNRVNVRKGPSTEHAVAWVYSLAGLPVEVFAEFEHWRQIRDSQGSEGWVFHALLSGRRTALVTQRDGGKGAISLYESTSTGSDVIAQLEPGVVGSVHKCDSTWCNITAGGHSGWIKQERLWGVYPGEILK